MLDLSLAIFVNKSRDIKYLTVSNIADIIRKSMQMEHPDLSEEERKSSQPNQFESGHVYFSAKQEKTQISLSHDFVGWENLIACTSET